MHLLHVTDRVSTRGGADVHLLAVIAALVERGHEVTLAVGRVDEAVAAPCEVRLVDGLEAPFQLEGAALAALDALAARADVVHIHNALSPEALGWAASRGAVATVQDHRSFCPGRGKLTLAGAPCTSPMSPELCAGCFEDAHYARDIQAITEARLVALRKMRAAIVLSDYMRGELAAVGVSATVIPPFVADLDPSAAPSGPPCILFAGRLVQAKGALEAAAVHRLAGIDLPLVFAGTGPLRRELERTHEVLGWIPRPALAAVYRRARAILMPSLWQEPFGIVGLEALTLGIPVAAWQSGAIPEWHPGPPLLTPFRDHEALAHALTLAIEHGPVRPTLDRFDRTTLTDRLEAVYRASR